MSSVTKQAGEFLVGMALAKKVISVAEGGRCCCAVAFWSEDGVAELFPDGVPNNTKIICDISMGSTSAEALIALGAPDNRNIRHLARMHAKLFMSNKGLVVGSANVSASALGHGNVSIRNTEAGTFHSPDSPSWASAAAWFDKLFNESTSVGDDEIKWAKLRYRPKPPVVQPGRITSGSLFDLVTTAPWRFSSVGFAFTSTPCTEKEKKEVRNQAKKSGKYDRDHLSKLNDNGTFFQWAQNDVRCWPEYFFSFWQPKEALYVYAHRVEAKILKIGSLMTSRDWRGLRMSCDVELPSRHDVSKADAKMALTLRGGYDGVFYANGSKLADRIAEIKAAGD